jgi:hypothetical protein
VDIAISYFSSIWVVGVSVEAAGSDVIKGFLNKSTVAAFVSVRGGAIEQVLSAQRDKFARFYLQLAFQSSSLLIKKLH